MMATALPDRIPVICEVMYERNKTLAHGNEDQRRQLTRMIAEQIAHELGTNWGTKSRSSTEPQSKDGIALKITTSGTMDIWDWQNGTTRKNQLVAGQQPDYPNITDQHFIAVTPTNHLGNGGTDPIPDPPNDDCIEKIEYLEVKVNELITVIEFQNDRISSLEMAITNLTQITEYLRDKPYPNYTGRVLWQNITLTPVIQR